MPEPDTSTLFPEIPEGWFRRAIIAAWLDGYRTHRFETQSAAIDAAIVKCDLLSSSVKQV